MQSDPRTLIICGLIDTAFDRQEIDTSDLENLRSADAPNADALRAFEKAMSMVVASGAAKAISSMSHRELTEMAIVFNHPWPLPFSAQCILLPLYLGMIVTLPNELDCDFLPPFIEVLLEQSPKGYWNRLQTSLMFAAILFSDGDPQFLEQTVPVLNYDASDGTDYEFLRQKIDRIWDNANFG